jgi:hypothetical protein
VKRTLGVIFVVEYMKQDGSEMPLFATEFKIGFVDTYKLSQIHMSLFSGGPYFSNPVSVANAGAELIEVRKRESHQCAPGEFETTTDGHFETDGFGV